MGDTVENYLNAAAMRKNLTLDTSITHTTFRVKRSSSEEVSDCPSLIEHFPQSLVFN